MQTWLMTYNLVCNKSNTMEPERLTLLSPLTSNPSVYQFTSDTVNYIALTPPHAMVSWHISYTLSYILKTDSPCGPFLLSFLRNSMHDLKTYLISRWYLQQHVIRSLGFAARMKKGLHFSKLRVIFEHRDAMI